MNCSPKGFVDLMFTQGLHSLGRKRSWIRKSEDEKADWDCMSYPTDQEVAELAMTLYSKNASGKFSPKCASVNNKTWTYPADAAVEPKSFDTEASTQRGLRLCCANSVLGFYYE